MGRIFSIPEGWVVSVLHKPSQTYTKLDAGREVGELSANLLLNGGTASLGAEEDVRGSDETLLTTESSAKEGVGELSTG